MLMFLERSVNMNKEVGLLTLKHQGERNVAWMGSYDCVLTPACVSPENQPNDEEVIFSNRVQWISLSGSGKAHKFNRGGQ